MAVTVEEILTYDGAELDIILNYIALTLSFVTTVLTLQSLPESFRLLRFFWVPLTILLFAFQITLCMLVGCVGISIVWCAYLSFSAYCYYAFPVYRNTSYMETEDGIQEIMSFSIRNCTLVALIFTAVVDMGLIIFYGIVSDVLTTVAHVSALILGLIVALLFQFFSKKWNPYSTLFRDPLRAEEHCLSSAY